MKVIIGSDHAGFEMKEKIKGYLRRKRIDFVDMGTFSTEPVDYPDIALKVSKKVLQDPQNKGILVCGSGTGMAIAANKVPGIRAVAAYDTYTAKMSRYDNDTNVLALRGRQFSYEKVREIVRVWLSTPFSSLKRHKRRIDKVRRIEQ